MTVINIAGVKGGVGTSTAAALAALTISRDREVSLCSNTLGGVCDLRAILGMAPDEFQVNENLRLSGITAGVSTTIVDAGTRTDLPCDLQYLVLRNDYLSIRRAVEAKDKADGFILFNEPKRALCQRDLEEVLGVPMAYVIEVTDATARSIDAGILALRPRITLNLIRSEVTV